MVMVKMKIDNRLPIVPVQTHLPAARIRVPRARLAMVWSLGDLEGNARRHIRLIVERLRIAKRR
ncbi:hypothetical protein [Paraburkholderia youngii]|uniref:hypothetical protein n=1 Tax=Paraburkholderia youngii TaxID=2782701 RepID=UPI001595B118|nr:hypothetical protein [Paraburkholderia youngii]